MMKKIKLLNFIFYKKYLLVHQWLNLKESTKREKDLKPIPTKTTSPNPTAQKYVISKEEIIPSST